MKTSKMIVKVKLMIAKIMMKTRTKMIWERKMREAIVDKRKRKRRKRKTTMLSYLTLMKTYKKCLPML